MGIQLNFGSHEYEFGERYVKEEFEKEILGLDRRPPHLPPPHTQIVTLDINTLDTLYIYIKL